MTVGALLIGALWLAGFLALTAVRAVRLNPSYEGAWPWSVWIAIASPLAAALAPLWLFMLSASWMLGYSVLAVALFAPLLLTAIAGTVGVFMPLAGKRE